MAKLTAREAAVLRMAMMDETAPLRQGDTNMSGEIGAAYPKMLYRKTETEEKIVVSQDKDGKPREWSILNRFNGLLCDTMVVDDADEAEALAADGWDVSPEAAHGQAVGLVAATTAKDDEIAALKALVEQLTAPPAPPTTRTKAEKEPVA